jgi:hypothetical protein
METKLTLKLEQSVIRSAKKYAQHNNRSLSKLVENYFRSLTPENRETAKKNISPLVKELSGVISEKDLEKHDYAAYLEQKYE